ncbi:hypothetical protein T492DRAFT_864215 [Pavlovales sp. CCMP2436]|nr:hypothetical protein T492DRAFT_864215 [Pavlovales sp. CCMP2436]
MVSEVHSAPREMSRAGWTGAPTAGAPPSLLHGHTTELYADRLFVLGGAPSTGAQLAMLDARTLRWAPGATFGSPPAARAWHTASLVGEEMYVFGGGDGKTVFRDLHALDLETLEQYAWHC